MATVQELLELREEVATKQAQVAEMEETVAALQEELAQLKGEVPTYTCPYCQEVLDSKTELDTHIAAVHPIYAEPTPWYKKPINLIIIGGITAIIATIAIKKKVAKS